MCNRVAQCLVGVLLLLAAHLPYVSGQILDVHTSSSRRWEALNMEEAWRTQSAAGGGRETIAFVVPFVSSLRERTILEVATAADSKLFAPEMPDRFGRPIGLSGAERLADIEQRVLNHVGVAATVEQRSAREISLYLVTTSGLVQAFDAETGYVRWTRVVGTQGQPVSLPGVSDEVIGTVVGTQLTLLSAWDGHPLQQRSLSSVPANSLAVHHDLAYVPWLRGGMEIFSIQDPQALTRHIRSTGLIAIPITLSGDLLAWSTEIGHVMVADARTGRIRFRLETRSPVAAPVSHAADGTLCFSTIDGLIWAVHSTTGAIRWQFMTGEPIHQAPLIHDGWVFAITDDGSLFAIDAVTGQMRWRSPGWKVWAGVVADRLIVVDQQNNLVAVQRDDGRRMGQAPMGDWQVVASHALADRIYLASSTGQVAMMRPVGHVLPTIYVPREERATAAVETPTTVPAAETKPTPTPPPVESTPTEEPPSDEPPPEDDPFAGATDPFG